MFPVTGRFLSTDRLKGSVVVSENEGSAGAAEPVECCDDLLDALMTSDPVDRACDYVFNVLHRSVDPGERWELIGRVKAALPAVLEEARALVVRQLAAEGVPVGGIADRLGVSDKRVYKLSAFPGRESWPGAATGADDPLYLLGAVFGVLDALVGQKGPLVRYRWAWDQLCAGHIAPAVVLARVGDPGNLRRWTGGHPGAVARVTELLGCLGCVDTPIPDRFGIAGRERFYLGFYHEARQFRRTGMTGDPETEKSK